MFLVVALVVGGTLCFLIPSLDGVDETSHFARSYQVSTGDLLAIGSPTRSFHGGGVCLPRKFAIDLTAARFRAAVRNRAYADGEADATTPPASVQDLSPREQQLLAQFEAGLTAALTPCRGAHAGKVFFDTSTFAWYSPLPYLPSAAGVGVARIVGLDFAGILHLARFGQLLAFVGIVFLAIRRTPWAKWPLCAAGLLPLSLFVASTVTPDAITAAFAFLVVSSALRMTARPTTMRAMLTEALVLSAALALCKPTYWIVTLAYLLPLLPLRSSTREIAGRPWFLLAPVVLAGGLSTLWQRSQRPLFVCDVRYFEVTPNPSRQVHLILTDPLHYVGNMAHGVRANAWNWVHDAAGIEVHLTHSWPGPLAVLILVGFLALALQRTTSDADVDLGPSRRALLLVTAVLGLVFVLTGLAVYCSAPGSLSTVFTNVRLLFAFFPLAFVALTAGRRHLVDRLPVPPALGLIPFYAAALIYVAVRV
ncbi:MAG TPA: DUF2142 domain-containing protein [Acidimicrobiia bacterium]